MESTTYKCKECEAIVIIKDGKVVRTCEHTEAVVVADIQAIAYGISSVN